MLSDQSRSRRRNPSIPVCADPVVVFATARVLLHKLMCENRASRFTVLKMGIPGR